MHKLALVVPTKDRPDDLRKLLSSLASQTRLPDQLIIVDGSKPDIQHVIAEFCEMAVDYVRVYPPSLSRQRNAGMQRLAGDITLAGYIDDDIVLESQAVEEMLRFWATAEADIGGAAFNITNAARPNWIRLKTLLWVDAPQAGKMLPSGFPSTIGTQHTDLETDWLYGGATVWRRDIVNRYAYDEWFIGMGFMEDVDYSFSVRREYRLKVVAGARLAHYSHPVKPEREALLGKWQIVNRMYFVRKHRARGLSAGSAWVASAGTTLLNIAFALFRGSTSHWLRAKGNVQGMFSELAGRRGPLGGHLK
jgi:glycosyltransferase involved in cell wall biosynthesis